VGGLGLGIPVFKPGVPVSLSQKHKCQHRFYIFTAFGLGTRLDTGTRNGTLFFGSERQDGLWTTCLLTNLICQKGFSSQVLRIHDVYQ
jgi:hypothetical protein